MSTKKRMMDMRLIELILLATGGVAGAFIRFKITESPLLFGALQVNVLIVNVIGSFILGIFVVMTQQWSLDQKYVLLVAVGFCGSLTTMSAFALETSNLMESKQFTMAAINILGNVSLSIGAIFGGMTLMNLITRGVLIK
jgi:CrcB protein